MSKFKTVGITGNYEISVRYATVNNERRVYIRKTNVEKDSSFTEDFDSGSVMYSKYQHLDVDTPIAAKPKARPRKRTTKT